jgi:Uma2 family endonuclease
MLMQMQKQKPQKRFVNPARSNVKYPDSDGQPMAETQYHLNSIIILQLALEDFFATRPGGAWTAANLFWYYEKGNPKARLALDVMIVPGLDPKYRRSFKSWDEPIGVPAVVFQFTSRKTFQNDKQKKRELYQQLGVQEYFMYDPVDQILHPQLQGFRLIKSRYRKIPQVAGRVSSQDGFSLTISEWMLRVIDQSTGIVVPTRREHADTQALIIQKLQAQIQQLTDGKSGPAHTQ